MFIYDLHTTPFQWILFTGAHEAATKVVQGGQQRGPGLRLARGPTELSQHSQEGLQQQLPRGLPKPIPLIHACIQGLRGA